MSRLWAVEDLQWKQIEEIKGTGVHLVSAVWQRQCCPLVWRPSTVIGLHVICPQLSRTSGTTAAALEDLLLGRFLFNIYVANYLFQSVIN